MEEKHLLLGDALMHPILIQLILMLKGITVAFDWKDKFLLIKIKQWVLSFLISHWDTSIWILVCAVLKAVLIKEETKTYFSILVFHNTLTLWKRHTYERENIKKLLFFFQTTPSTENILARDLAEHEARTDVNSD